MADKNSSKLSLFKQSHRKITWLRFCSDVVLRFSRINNEHQPAYSRWKISKIFRRYKYI